MDHPDDEERASPPSIAALVEDLTDVRWSHPAWLSLAGGTALLERMARWRPDALEEDVYATYLSANGSPRSDTFMARDRGEDDRSAAASIARAVLRASAAVGAVSGLARELPGQPLDVGLRFDGGWLRRAPIVRPGLAVFVTPRGRFVAGATPSDELARALGAACAGQTAGATLQPLDGDGVPADAAVAVDVSLQPGGTARHLHRRAWTSGGGPWLGVGETGTLELVTTCHLAVDGYGHGLLAARTFAAVDAGRGELARLTAAARAGLGADTSLPEASEVEGSRPLGFAGEVVDGAEVNFPRASYALGRTLDALRPTARSFAPTFSVAVAPGDRGDALRRLRRVAFILVSLRKLDGEIESFEAFRARLRELVAAETSQPGLLMRILAATAKAPLPRALRRRLLSSDGSPSRWLPPVEVLAGRASLSLIRHVGRDLPPAPLYAASAPGLAATRDDPMGSFVITILDHGSKCTVSLDGTGFAGTDAGAHAVLTRFLAELRAIEKS